MTDKEKRELKDNIINIFKRFNLLGNTASIGELKNNILRCVDFMQKDPVSEGLEEVSKNYALNNTPWDDCKDEIQESFKAGSKWKEQQIMAIAVDGIARPYDNEIWCILDSFNLKDGDEVKVIVIKEK